MSGINPWRLAEVVETRGDFRTFPRWSQEADICGQSPTGTYAASAPVKTTIHDDRARNFKRGHGSRGIQRSRKMPGPRDIRLGWFVSVAIVR